MDIQPTTNSKAMIIKSIYFYLVSFVALMMVAFSSADLINMALKTWIFTKADNYTYRVDCPTAPYYDEKGAPINDPTVKTQRMADCEKQQEINQKNEDQNRVSQRQNNIVRDISMIVVGIPLFLIHWRIVRSKNENL